MGVFQVVKEHHGAKNGIGFNDSQSISLQSLSMFYLIVEDFVDAVLKVETPAQEDIQKICMELQKKYTKGIYKKAADALSSICLTKKISKF